jgi:hypothetical protein
MVDGAKTWMRQNATLIYFLIAQFIAIGAGAASVLAYMVKLETRVAIMETRGAEYTVLRMEEMKLRISKLEQDIAQNHKSIDRIVEVMTKKLNINP